MSRGREVTVGTDILGTVFSIVACTRAPKAFGEEGSGMTSNGNIEEASGGRDDWAIVTNSYNKGLVASYCILIQAILRVNGSKERRGVGWSRGGQLCEQR